MHEQIEILVLKFQFHKVQLKASYFENISDEEISFNSIRYN